MESSPKDSRGRVLVADDDPAVREGLVLLLGRSGFACDGVASAAEATERMGRVEYDVLIADINMPGNVALEFIATLPTLAAGLPVVLLTGSPSVETAARSVRLPVVAYLTKPPDPDELGRVLDEAVAHHRGLRALRLSRVRLRDWEHELAGIEATLRQTRDIRPGGPMGSYLRVSLRQVILMLAELERATQSLEHDDARPLERVDHVAALRRTVEVLERTRQNFKSKDLADLRKQLERLLGPEGGSRPPV
jgi:CheY-like chemotaxis protein